MRAKKIVWGIVSLIMCFGVGCLCFAIYWLFANYPNVTLSFGTLGIMAAYKLLTRSVEVGEGVSEYE